MKNLLKTAMMAATMMTSVAFADVYNCKESDSNDLYARTSIFIENDVATVIGFGALPMTLSGEGEEWVMNSDLVFKNLLRNTYYTCKLQSEVVSTEPVIVSPNRELAYTKSCSIANEPFTTADVLVYKDETASLMINGVISYHYAKGQWKLIPGAFAGADSLFVADQFQLLCK